MRSTTPSAVSTTVLPNPSARSVSGATSRTGNCVCSLAASSSLAIEHGADPHERRAFLRRDAVVLARAHREFLQSVLPRELRETAEVLSRRLGIARLGRHRHQTAHVRVRREEARELPGLDPGLRLLAGKVDLDERGHAQLARSRLGVERVDELADPVHDLRLVRLQVADEVPAENIAVFGVLRLEILCAILADDVNAGLGENLHVCKRHVLRRRDDRHVRADLLAYTRVLLADVLRRYTRSLPGARLRRRRGGARRSLGRCMTCRARSSRPTRRRRLGARARPPREYRGCGLVSPWCRNARDRRFGCRRPPRNSRRRSRALLRPSAVATPRHATLATPRQASPRLRRRFPPGARADLHAAPRGRAHRACLPGRSVSSRP